MDPPSVKTRRKPALSVREELFDDLEADATGERPEAEGLHPKFGLGKKAEEKCV